MIKKYVTIPIEVEAVQYTGTNFSEIENFVQLHSTLDLLKKLKIYEENYKKLERRLVIKNVSTDAVVKIYKNDFLTYENKTVKHYNKEQFFKQFKES